jgi:hypothetical protein
MATIKPFTAEEFRRMAKEHQKVAETALSIGPNIAYARTFLGCAEALRVAAEVLEGGAPPWEGPK